ncbi:hypothetical protein [Trinickia sp.]|uniref:hypothetical protein n=1 Tax=Trinickia sp. TaxID=2571163 RepID=UPI003F808AB3
MWASEQLVREVYARKSALAVLTCFAGALLGAAGAMVYMLAVHGAGHPVLAAAAFVPFAFGASLGAAVSGRNLRRIVRFGSGLPWAQPALRLGDDCLSYFDLLSVPCEDIVDTRGLEVSTGRGGHRAYVLLFVRGATSDYAKGGMLNRREIKSAASMLRFAVQNQWPPFPQGDFVVLDVDFLSGVYAPRLKVWIDRVRSSARTLASDVSRLPADNTSEFHTQHS